MPRQYLYRNTLKLLISRLYGALSPDMFTLEVNDGTRRLVDRISSPVSGAGILLGKETAGAYSEKEA